MSDVETRLGRLGSTTQEAPQDSVVTNDVHNATHARATRNRRRAQVAAGTCLVAAVIALAVNTAVQPTGPTPATRAHAHATSTRQGLSLVSYTGDQERGFIIKKVPEGYVLQGSTGTVLDVARADDTSPLDSFAHKLVVTIATT